MPTTTFGAIMMGKNEEELLPQCLASIVDHVDEIIFVDTGSTDRTVEIAESFGAKIFHHPWEDNYSLHRNQSLGYSTCDWVFQIDCDEKLVGDGVKNLRPIVDCCDSSDVNAISIILHNMIGGRIQMRGNLPRIFRKKGLSYEKIVHNLPVFEGDAAAYPGIIFEHYGEDLSPERMKEKENRRLNLLYKRLDVDPEDYQVYFYLAQIYGGKDAEDVDKQLECCKKYIDNRDNLKRVAFNDSIWFTYLTAIEKKEGLDHQDYENALAIAREELPNDIDILYSSILYAVHKNEPGKLAMVCSQYLFYLSQIEQKPELCGTRFIYCTRPECKATALYYLVGRQLAAAQANMAEWVETIEKTDDVFKKASVGDMEKQFESIGLNWKFKREK